LRLSRPAVLLVALRLRLLAVLLLPMLPRRRPRWRVCLVVPYDASYIYDMAANNLTEKEESDDDMGFGLFD